MAHDVFISYSHADKKVADATCAALERNGIRCWIAPRDITPGSEWSTAIIEAIERCHAIVLIFSASANNSRQIRREVERAINAGIPLVPVRIENVVPTESLAYFMSTVHWLDALSPPLEEHLHRLAQAIKGLLGIHTSVSDTSAQPNATRDAWPADTELSIAASADARKIKRGAFYEIMNFSYRRNWYQAIAWYALFFVLGVLISFTVGRIIDIVLADRSAVEKFTTGLQLGQLLMIPYAIALATLLLWRRPKDARNVVLEVVGVALGAIFGALGGLIPLALLTKRPVQCSAK